MPANPPAFPWAKEPQLEAMTLRDHFAGQVAAAVMVNATGIMDERAKQVCPLVARIAYKMADALLAERERSQSDAS